MNSTALEAVITATWAEINRLLIVKGGEYAGTEDRLANFKRGSSRVGVHPLQILWIYAAKHIDAIETFVRDTASGTVRERSEPIEGRIDDLINYCLLAKGILAELRAEQALELDRNTVGHPGGFHRVVPVDPVCPPLPVQPEAVRGNVGGDGDPLHRVEPGPEVRYEAAVQPPPYSATGQVKPFPECWGCHYEKASTFSFPCCNCVNADRRC